MTPNRDEALRLLKDLQRQQSVRSARGVMGGL